jgi:hypothetical protein
MEGSIFAVSWKLSLCCRIQTGAVIHAVTRVSTDYLGTLFQGH